MPSFGRGPCGLALAFTAALLTGACATQTVTSKRVLQPGEAGTSDVIVGKMPACEPGQTSAQGKCQDVIVPGPQGTQETLRAREARAECERAEWLVRGAVSRRHEIMARQGHDVHLALNAINTECRARAEQIAACERAVRAESPVITESELVRKRDALETCGELAEVYRTMLAQGLKHAP